MTLEPLEWRLLLSATPGPFYRPAAAIVQAAGVNLNYISAAAIGEVVVTAHATLTPEDGSNWLSSVTVVATLGSGSAR